MEQKETSLKEKARTDLREPRQYKVILHNDDFTTFDFVVKILTTIFYKTETEAQLIAETVHKSGQATIGVYSLDVAASKVRKATRLARQEGFPLRLTYTPID